MFFLDLLITNNSRSPSPPPPPPPPAPFLEAGNVDTIYTASLQYSSGPTTAVQPQRSNHSGPTTAVQPQLAVFVWTMPSLAFYKKLGRRNILKPNSFKEWKTAFPQLYQIK